MKPARLFLISLLFAAALLASAGQPAHAYRVRYFTYEVIKIEGNDITLRSRSGKKTLVINKDPKKFNLKVGDYVRYNSRYNRLRVRSKEKEMAFQERQKKERMITNGR